MWDAANRVFEENSTRRKTFLKLTACYFQDGHYPEIVTKTGKVETSAVVAIN